MADDIRAIVDAYCRTWDVDAPDDLIDEVYAATSLITIPNPAREPESMA